MIKKIILISLALLSATTMVNAESSKINEYKMKIEKILPTGWELTNISENAVPYNLALLESEKPGISFELTGPPIDLALSDPHKGKIRKTSKQESMEIWVMSADYSGSESEMQGQFYKATLLGANNEISVYIKAFFSDTLTWKNWREDLIKLFELKTHNKSIKGTLTRSEVVATNP